MNPGDIYQAGQAIASAGIVVDDWFVVQTNGRPATAPLSVVVINQANATQRFSAQPFASFPVPNGFPTSWAPMSVSVDPDHNLIYTANSSPGVIRALELTADGLRAVWTAHQRTTEFLALIGPRDRRCSSAPQFRPAKFPTRTRRTSSCGGTP